MVNYVSFLHYEQLCRILGAEVAEQIKNAPINEKHKIFDFHRKGAGLILRSSMKLEKLSTYVFERAEVCAYYEEMHGKEKVDKDIKEYCYN